MTLLAVEDVQDYPRPPALEPVPQALRAVFAGVPIVDADAGQAWRVLETHHAPTYYIPLSAILASALVPVGRETFCEWKGRASYFDVIVNGRRARNAAWAYTAPTARFEPIKDHVAFYASALDEAWVGDIRVAAQPGDFYGGWVTPNLTGRIKGAAGTMHW